LVASKAAEEAVARSASYAAACRAALRESTEGTSVT
jgi:hypothetical protein